MLWAGLRIRIHFIRIRIQHFRMDTNQDPDPIRIQGFKDQRLKKKLKLKFFFFSKNAIYLSLGLHKVCPSYRRSLQLSNEAIQHFKTWTFTNFFLLFWIIFDLLDPDPDSEPGLRIRIHWPDWIRIQFRIRIRNPGCEDAETVSCSARDGFHLK